METGLKNTMEDALKQALNLQDVDVSAYSPLVLAYIGDAVYELSLIHI